VEARDGYRVVRCGTQLKCFSQPISLLMGFELRKARPDLIHYHAPNLWSALMIVLFCPRTPIIVTHHADIEGRRLLKRIVMRLYHHLLKRTRCILVNSKKDVRTSTDLPRDLPRVLAVAATILTAIYHMLKDGTMYHDLDREQFDRRSTDQQKKSLVKRLADLGYAVEIKPLAATA
jgi:glycosyltransferase involved in cell wall biosynthesis